MYSVVKFTHLTAIKMIEEFTFDLNKIVMPIFEKCLHAGFFFLCKRQTLIITRLNGNEWMLENQSIFATDREQCETKDGKGARQWVEGEESARVLCFAFDIWIPTNVFCHLWIGFSILINCRARASSFV